MGVGAGLYMYVVDVQKFTFAISSPDEFLLLLALANVFNSTTEAPFALTLRCYKVTISVAEM